MKVFRKNSDTEWAGTEILDEMQCWKLKAYVQAVRSKDDPKPFTTTISNLAIVISWNNSWNEWRRFLNIRLVSGDNKYKPEIKSVELCERTEKTTENTAVLGLTA